jgi:hypothetical protein
LKRENEEGVFMMIDWEAPLFEEIKMDAEIGSYRENDDDSGREEFGAPRLRPLVVLDEGGRSVTLNRRPH